MPPPIPTNASGKNSDDAARPPQVWDRREFLKTAAAGSALALFWPTFAAGLTKGGGPEARRVCERIAGTTFGIEGWIQSYLSAVTEQWLKVAPASNPAILEMFRDRNRQPLRELLPWSGEFAGKYLTESVQVYRVTRDPSLRAAIIDFTGRLIALQAPNGYLGPWPAGHELTGEAPNCITRVAGGHTPVVVRPTWDAWGHYHAMLGLLLWHDESGDPAVLECVRKIGDLFCSTFEDKRLVDTGSTEMNLAPIHALCLLYERTGEPRYLDLAQEICLEFAATDAQGRPLAGDYVRATLSGKDYFELPKPRWESLHSVMGLAELHAITGEPTYREAVERIWWSIAKGDRHNNGGFSSGEKACGNPYNSAPIETCCTIAWIALGVEVLRLTGNSRVADELELSTLNSVVGMHSPNGRWVTYNTPMDGVRKASGQDIVFQAREGSPELSCCSVNGARGFGLISDWAVMSTEGGILLNWYGPCAMKVPIPAGRTVEFRLATDYPRGNEVRLTVSPSEPTSFALHLRIPGWSRRTTVLLNGHPVASAEAGSYLVLDRSWKAGDTIDLTFDFSLQFWVGERECEGKVSIYRGPILLTYDRRHNAVDPERVPALQAKGLEGEFVSFPGWLPPMMLLRFTAIDGQDLTLCDFGSAGFGGSPYRTWLEVKGCSKTEFSRESPRRTGGVS